MGHKLIYFLFCSEYIITFLHKCGITSFNEVTSSDHRELFLELHLTSILKKSYIFLLDHTSRSLKSSNTKSVINYKKHLRTYVDRNIIIEQATELQNKIINSNISPNDHNDINKLDVPLTTGMINVKRMIKKHGLQFPWSPILATAILELPIWKLTKSEWKKILPVLLNSNNERMYFTN